MKNFAAVLLLPDPLFAAQFLKQDLIYGPQLARCKTKENYDMLIKVARRELNNLIIYSGTS